MAMATFYGVVVTYGKGRDSTPCLAVCCASRITRKKFAVISLEGDFADEASNFALEPGQLVTGKAKILKTCDGSILAQFYAKELKLISGDSRNRLFEYAYNPRAKREIVPVGRAFYKFRLDTALLPNQLSWRKNDTPFTELALNLLNTNGSSMASLEGAAIFFTWITNKKNDKVIFSSLYERDENRKARNGKKKKSAKAALFLLAPENDDVHAPIFFLAKLGGMRLEKGGLYHFRSCIHSRFMRV